MSEDPSAFNDRFREVSVDLYTRDHMERVGFDASIVNVWHAADEDAYYLTLRMDGVALCAAEHARLGAVRKAAK